MAKAFDATLNTLIDAHLTDWAHFLAGRVGVPIGPATSLDTDLSATLQADRLFRIDGLVPSIVHLELESTSRLGIPGELLRYNVAAWGSLELPVHSVLVVLRPKANASDLTGCLTLTGADGRGYLEFRYTVVRVWEESVSGLLKAGLGLAPLALLTNEAAADLPTAFTRFQTLLRSDGSSAKVERGLLGSTFVLCGLRYPRQQIVELYQNMSLTLEDSTTFQMILEKGIAQGRSLGMEQGISQGISQGMTQEAQSLILRLCAKRFGPATPETETAVRTIADRERLERMTDRILEATGWPDLLATK